MKKIISFLAYSWAFLSIILLLSAFVNMNSYQTLLMKLPFMRLDPLYSGGEVAFNKISNGDTLQIHEPVFSAFFGESKEGFVQINIISDKELARDTVDYNNDGCIDFVIVRDNGQFTTESCTNELYYVNDKTAISNGWLVRIGLHNPRKK